VLLLEDDEDLRESIFELLDESGYDVVAAGNGEEALERFAGPAFEIAVFDVKLPGIDGLEVLSEIKAQNPKLLSIVITGYATEKDTIRALRLGVGDYLQKPFSMSQLLESTARLAKIALERRATERKEQSALRLMLWSLEMGLGSLDLNSGRNRLSTARQMEQAAEAGGHQASAVQQTKASLLYLFLKEASAEPEWEQLSLLDDLLPPTIAAASEAIKNQQGDYDGSLLGLASLAYRASEDENLQNELARILAESDSREGRVGAERTLLSLARTLLASGQTDAARKALEEAVTLERVSVEKGVALVELSLLCHREGDPRRAKQLLRDAVAGVASLGPQAGAELSLEAGLASLSMGLKDGAKLLSRILPLLERLKLTNLVQLTELTLALAEFPEASPPESLDIDHYLLRYHAWFFPRLLTFKGDEESEKRVQKVLSRLAMEAPRQVARLILSSTNEQFVLSFLKSLADWNLNGYPEMLELLASRKDWPEVQMKAHSLISSEKSSNLPILRFYSLGSFDLWLGAERVPEVYWRTVRSRFLLACLVSRHGRPILQETLIEQFWPGANPKSGRKNLSQVLSDARKALYEAGFPESIEPIVRRHDTVMINEEIEWWHDLDRFEDLHEKGRRALDIGDRTKAYQHLREAVSLMKGPYLEDCPMEWAAVKRRDLERMSAELHDSLGRCCQSLGLYPEAVEMAERMLNLDPCNQRAHLLAMEAYQAHGRAELALRQFEQAEKSLKQELGVEPSTELLRAFHQAKMSL
jgi:two-component SAPR family response regulator